VKHVVQRGIWVPTQHLLWDQGKPRKILIELAGGRTFWMQSAASSPALNMRALALVPIRAVALLKKTFTSCFTNIYLCI
jgi:hypothetical protein